MRQYYYQFVFILAITSIVVVVVAIGGNDTTTTTTTESSVTTTTTITTTVQYPTEPELSEIQYLPDHKIFNRYTLPLPHTYLHQDELPSTFRWDRIIFEEHDDDDDNDNNVTETKIVSYLTRSLNQHLPQYCGSCWAHGALSSFADRIKIARKGASDDINLSIQYILNCGTTVAGSCNGGSDSGVYDFIRRTGYVPYDTCQPYLACSSDSTYGFCPYVNTSCSPYNTCRTCTMKIVPSIHPFNQICREIDSFPNASIAEYGRYEYSEESVTVTTSSSSLQEQVHKIKSEIFARGPVSASVNGKELHTYQGGIYTNTNTSTTTTHIVSIIGWGNTADDDNNNEYLVDRSSSTSVTRTVRNSVQNNNHHDIDNDDDNDTIEYWIVRNSWGQYWGEMGFFRIATGQNLLGIESSIVWATPDQYTVVNYPCNEDGTNCASPHNTETSSSGYKSEKYIDPSHDPTQIQRRLQIYAKTTDKGTIQSSTQ